MQLKWSIADEQQGARKVEKTMSKLGKNKNKYNCVCKPMYGSIYIPIHQVVIDTLHLFLQISYVLINLVKLLQISAEKNNQIFGLFVINHDI